MKRAFLPLCLVLLLPLAACDSGDSDGDGPGAIPSGPSDNRVSWRAGGTSYSAEGDGQSNPLAGAALGFYVGSGVGGGGQFSLNATAIDGTTPAVLNLSAAQLDGEGEYALSLNNGSLMSLVLTEVDGTSAVTTSYVGESGSLTIAELTETGMRGTFSFDAANQDDPSDTVAITNGTFSVAFQQ